MRVSCPDGVSRDNVAVFLCVPQFFDVESDFREMVRVQPLLAAHVSRLQRIRHCERCGGQRDLAFGRRGVFGIKDDEAGNAVGRAVDRLQGRIDIESHIVDALWGP